MTDQTPDPTVPSAAPAGWYPDPQNPGQQRYWDGSAWTATTPAAPAAPGVAPAPGPTTSTNAIVGLVLAIVSWVVCPIIAAIAALVIARNSDKEIAASGGRVDGSGLNTATRIIAWLNIGVSIVGGLVVIVLVALGVLFASTVESSLDPAINSRTGLDDGDYLMDPERWASINGECTYGGPVVTPDGTDAGDVTVYGDGPAECPDLEFVNVIYFEVQGGVARIVDVE